MADVVGDLAVTADPVVVVAGSEVAEPAAGSASRWKMMTRTERAMAARALRLPRRLARRR